MDNDQLIIVQDGKSRIIVISISAMAELQARTQYKQKSAGDGTLNVEAPDTEREFELGFIVDKEKLQVASTTAKDEDSDQVPDDIRGTVTIEVDFEIINMYRSRSCCALGYLAIVGAYRLAIYDVYDEYCAGADHKLLWDMNYRFDNSVKKYGMHTCVDFEDKGLTFVSGTNIGYVCVWSLEKREMLSSFRVINPQTEKPQSIDLIRNMHLDSRVVTFDTLT